MSLALTLTDAIVSALNAGDFTETFTAQRKLVPRKVDADFDGVLVDAIPTPQSREVETRNNTAKVQTVAIVVDRKVQWDATLNDVNHTQADEVIVTAEEIADFLLAPANRNVSSGGTSAVIVSSEIGQGIDLLDPELLYDHELARCVVLVQMRVL
jgi:hypothetical protein